VYRHWWLIESTSVSAYGDKNGVPMGPSNKVRAPDLADAGPTGETGSVQLQAGQRLSPSEKAATRQCGRCRQYFPADPPASPQPKWWACTPCRHKLFGTEE
jgi:hypothetical protein